MYVSYLACSHRQSQPPMPFFAKNIFGLANIQIYYVIAPPAIFFCKKRRGLYVFGMKETENEGTERGVSRRGWGNIGRDGRPAE